MKKALITGITGQDGAYLARFLLDKGYEVFGTYRRVSTPNFWRLMALNVLNKVTLIPADIADMSSLLEVVTRANPEEIYNLGAQSYVGASFDQPLLTGEIDGLGVVRFLEIIRHLNKDIKFYQASTSELYGSVMEDIQTKHSRFWPNSPYAAAKLYSFHSVRIYREAYGLFACNGILFNHECVSENTPVIVRNKRTAIISIKCIKDIKKAKTKGSSKQQWFIENIEIWDGEQFVDLKFMTATRRKQDNDFHCKTINSRHGIVETTNHHNMILQDGTKAKACEVEVGYKLYHGSFPMPHQIARLTREEAMFLGMMVGDGYISEDGIGQFCNNNKDIMLEFEMLWRQISLGTVELRWQKTEYGNAQQARLNGNAGYLKNVRKEIYTKGGLKKVPDRILNAEKDAKLAFLIGYNLTDGLKANRCTYDFKNFKTNSAVLAQGLIFLIQQITGQDYNITFERNEGRYGYYSINFLSPVNNLAKECEVKELLEDGFSQRAIARETGISRVFIQKIQNGGQAMIIHHMAKQKEEVKKIFYHEQQPEWVYDIETTSGKFMAGVGKIIVSNSPLRGLEFVTRKISNAVARIKLGMQKELKLGNLETKRDWGYAPEYVESMHMILNHKEPEDFVVATGETHSVREFVDLAFKAVNLNYEDYVKEHEHLKRPKDVDFLKGDYSEITEKIGWRPRTKIKELVNIMVKADLNNWERYTRGEIFPWDAPNYHEDINILTRAVTKK